MKPESDTAAMRAPNRFSTSRSAGGPQHAAAAGDDSERLHCYLHGICRFRSTILHALTLIAAPCAKAGGAGVCQL